MKILKKLKMKTKDDKKVRQIYFFDIPILQYERDENKKYSFKLLFNQKNKSTENVFYLKINNENDYASICFQNWLDVVNLMQWDFYIICDKDFVLNKILKNCVFYDTNIKIIKSDRSVKYKNIFKNIKLPKKWYNAGLSHITTFTHSISNNIKTCWNIDADDTMIMCSPQKTVKILQKAQQNAIDQEYDLYSLDMHESRSFGRYWTFGITYQCNPKKILSAIQSVNIDQNVKKEIAPMATYNLDFLFTYCRLKCILKISDFYIDKTTFLHYGLLFKNSPLSFIRWTDGFAYNPVLEKYNLCKFVIPQNTDKIEANITEEDYIDTLEKKILQIEKAKLYMKKYDDNVKEGLI